jgi:hypothetical protein
MDIIGFPESDPGLQAAVDCGVQRARETPDADERVPAAWSLIASSRTGLMRESASSYLS